MDAIPLPSRPNLEQYKKQAKDLAKAEQIPLTRAQYLLAQRHAFASWAKFAKHVRELEREQSPNRLFEIAADAIVDGDIDVLRSLLREHPELIRATSAREHASTLLHYVSANGVEDYRQKTPANIVAITRLLLDAGAEVDAPQASYGGNGTTLGLVATSIHPDKAGVTIELMEMLVAAGANLEGRQRGWPPLRSAFANGQPEAARWLADHGARVDLESAAALGRLDLVETIISGPKKPSKRDINAAFRMACMYGRLPVVKRLLTEGAGAAGSKERSSLHDAAFIGHRELIEFLLARGVDVNNMNSAGVTPLDVAQRASDRGYFALDYGPAIAALKAAGARHGSDLRNSAR